MKKRIIATSALCLMSSFTFANTYNLYSSKSTDSKVLAKINLSKNNGYFKFYTDKNGNWAKLANNHNGITGWLDLKKINEDKADHLRKNILSNINKNIDNYSKKILALKKEKTQISSADYKELLNYKYNDSYTKGSYHVFREWTGKDGKVHKFQKTWNF